MLIKAAINGGRSKDEHPAAPVSPDEQAAAAIDCLQRGADAVHLHVRSEAGTESLYPQDLARTLRAVLAVCPTEQIGVSTGAWILPNTAERLEAVAGWEVLPGFASVNFGEEKADEMARLLFSRGVAVEAGLCDANSAEILRQSGLTDRCIRILVEPQEQKMAMALRTVGEIESVLDSTAVRIPRLLHGTEATAWPMMAEAIKRGYGVRIGLEDTLFMPDGTAAGSNAELVAQAVRQVRDAHADGKVTDFAKT